MDLVIKSKKKVLQLIFVFSYFFIILLLAKDSYQSLDAVSKYLYLDSSVFLGGYLAFATFLAIKKIRLPFLIRKINFSIFVISTFFAVIVNVIDYFMPGNFAYNYIPIRYEGLTFMSIATLLTMLVNLKGEELKRNYKKIIFSSGIILILYAVLMSLWPFDAFQKLSHEDSLIENLQVFVLLAGCVFSFMIFRRIKNKMKYLFLILAIGLFFVAGEEISWGQRILGIETPERLAEINTQGETTIHNIVYIDGKVPIGYSLIGFLGAFLWIIGGWSKRLIKFVDVDYLIPPKYLFVFFFFGFAYNGYTLLPWDHTIGVWSEFAELMLYSGISLFVMSIYLGFHPEKNVDYKK